MSNGRFRVFSFQFSPFLLNLFSFRTFAENSELRSFQFLSICLLFEFSRKILRSEFSIFGEFVYFLNFPGKFRVIVEVDKKWQQD